MCVCDVRVRVGSVFAVVVGHMFMCGLVIGKFRMPLHTSVSNHVPHTGLFCLLSALDGLADMLSAVP